MKSQVEEAKRAAAKELLSCPHCGGGAVFQDRYDAALDFDGDKKPWWGIECTKCSASSNTSFDKAYLTEQWNTRFDAGRDHSDEKVTGETLCDCGHIKYRHNFMDESETSLDGCYPEDGSDCDCPMFRAPNIPVHHSDEGLREAIGIVEKLKDDWRIFNEREMNALRTLLAAVRPSSWVRIDSVKDLPKEQGTYLVYMSEDDAFEVVDWAKTIDGKCHWLQGMDNYDDMGISHWQKISGPQIEQEKP